MQHILVYSDSLSWGIIPNTRQRLSVDKRWPGVLETCLKANQATRVIENCLNGRRTVWSDPFKAGRNGSEGLAQVIEINSPLALVILMLGHNDFQDTHNNNAWLSAQGMAQLIHIIREAPIEPDMPVPDILVIAPPVITTPKGAIANKFKGAPTRSEGLARELKKVCEDNRVDFFDSNTVITASALDGIHIDEKEHQLLGEAVADYIVKYIN